MIVVMGASGRVGSAVLSALSASGRPVRAISRQPRESGDGIEWVTCDALDAQDLGRAFAGADAVFLLSPVRIDSADVHADASRISAAIAEALRIAGVPHAVALSSQGAHLATGTGVVGTLHEFEDRLRQAPTPMTFLRPAYFMENWVPFAQIAAETGELPALIDPVDKAIDTISARDVGAIAAEYLLDPRPGIVNLVGPRRYGEADAAAILARLAAREISLVPVPAEQVAAMHEAAGLGRSFAAGTAALYRAINSDTIPFQDAGAARRAGTRSPEQVLAEALRGGTG